MKQRKLQRFFVELLSTNFPFPIGMCISSPVQLWGLCLMQCAYLLKLLDEVDIDLFGDERFFSYRHILSIGIEFVGLFSIVYLIVGYSLICVLLSLAFIIAVNVVLPYAILMLTFSRFDSTLHRFLTLLKRREISLFSTSYAQLKSNEQPLLIQKRSRIICLERTRRLINVFETASDMLAALSKGKFQPYEVENRKALSKFINADLRALISLDGTIDEDFLSISSLRTCWQFQFLVRSEFLRLFIISIMVQPSWKVVQIMMRTIYAAFDSFEEFYKVSSNVHAKRSQQSYGKQAALSSYESAIYQLEWILESLHSMGKIPEGKAAQSHIQSLESIISTIQNNSQKNFPQFDLPSPAQSEDDDGKEINESVDLLKDNIDQTQIVEDFQIYEMDSENDNLQLLNFDSEASEQSTCPDRVDIRPILCELNQAILRRKDIYIEREITALAKFRRVPTNQIERVELDRPGFAAVMSLASDDAMAVSQVKDACNEHNLDVKASSIHIDNYHLAVNRGALGRALTNNDLAAILAQRNNFLASRTNVDAEFGDETSDYDPE